MPELPEIVAYIDALESRVVDQVLEKVRIRTPSLLRTYEPRVSELEGKRVTGLRRIGKRVVLQLEDGVAPVEWTPDLLREKGVHSAKNETTVRAGVPASNS